VADTLRASGISQRFGDRAVVRTGRRLKLREVLA
jgi:hypothetical protein